MHRHGPGVVGVLVATAHDPYPSEQEVTAFNAADEIIYERVAH